MRLISFLCLCALLAGCATTSGKKDTYNPLQKKFEMAKQYYDQGLFTQSESLYLEISRKHPKLYEPHMRLGNLYVRVNQLDAAILRYEKALALKPNDVKAWNNLALVRVKQAIKILEEGQVEFESNSFEYIALESHKQKLIGAVAQKR